MFPPKHVFSKIKTFIMATYGVDDGGDALTKFYHGVAQTLQDEGDDTLLKVL